MGIETYIYRWKNLNKRIIYSYDNNLQNIVKIDKIVKKIQIYKIFSEKVEKPEYTNNQDKKN